MQKRSRSSTAVGVSARRYVRLLVALGLAAWWLFWFQESMGSRVERIRQFELALRHVEPQSQIAPRCIWNGGIAWCEDQKFMPLPGGTGE